MAANNIDAKPSTSHASNLDLLESYLQQSSRSFVPKIDRKSKSTMTQLSRTNGPGVIYGFKPMKVLKKKSSLKLSQMKAPWVPPPGKATTAASAKEEDFNQALPSNPFHHVRQSNMDESTSSKSSCASSVPNLPIKRIPKPSKPKRRVKVQSKPHPSVSKINSNDKNALKGEHEKDSLAEVTEFLESRHEDIQKLRSHPKLVEDSHLRQALDKASELVQDAIEEVELLRESIQHLQEKDSSMSDKDCDMLDQLRQIVLEKIKEFEEAHSEIHRIITEETDNDQAPEVFDHNSHANQSENEKVSTALESLTISEQEDNHDDTGLQDSSPERNKGPKSIAPQTHPNPAAAVKSRSNTTATTTVPSFGRLAQMYKEPYQVPLSKDQKRGNGNDASKPEVSFDKEETEREIGVIHNQIQNIMKLLRKTGEDDTQSKVKQNPMTSFNQTSSFEQEYNNGGGHYEHKVQELQGKLIDAESEIVQLRDELERVESEANFQVRLLKSNFEERLNDLEFPDNESMGFGTHPSGWNNETQALVDKQYEEIQYLKTVNGKLQESIRKDVDFLRTFNNEKDSMQRTIQDLQTSNESLRQDIERKNQEIGELSEKLKSQNQGPIIPAKYQGESIPNLIRKNRDLEQKIEEVEDRLARSHKRAEVLQVAKDKLKLRMHQREDELMRELEDARERSSVLQRRIQFIRTSYKGLFPPDIFTEGLQHGGGRYSKGKGQPFRTTTTRLPTPGQGIVRESQNREPEIVQEKTWVTGQGHAKTPAGAGDYAAAAQSSSLTSPGRQQRANE